MDNDPSHSLTIKCDFCKTFIYSFVISILNFPGFNDSIFSDELCSKIDLLICTFNVFPS